jgi:hypothetical protein
MDWPPEQGLDDLEDFESHSGSWINAVLCTLDEGHPGGHEWESSDVAGLRSALRGHAGTVGRNCWILGLRIRGNALTDPGGCFRVATKN